MTEGVSPSGPGCQPSASAADASSQSGIPNAWQINSAKSVVDLIREVGIYRLGGYDGCPCTNFEVQNIAVDVSCHKSEQTVRVYTHHLDYCDENYKRCDAALKPIADEVLRQVDAHYDAGGSYAAEFTVCYRSWDEDHGHAQGGAA